MKVQNEMSTRITVDTVEATNSMKAFRQAITANTQAWKANEIALKNSGDYAQAAQERVKGLTEVMKIQQARIGELKLRQEGLDQSTESGARSYIKLQKEINSATRQLNSYAGQVERAKSNAEYYSSGLADLQKQYRLNQSASSALSNRLKAEGKTMENNSVRYKAAQSSLESLKKQYQAQETMLQKVAAESGKTSEAYQKQKTQLDRTGESIAKAKSEVSDLQEEYNRLHPTGITVVDKSALKLGEHTEGLKAKVKGMASAFRENYLMVSGVIGVVARAAKEGADSVTNLQDTYLKTNNLLITSGEKTAEVTKNVNKMQSEGREMSIKYGTSQQDIANAYQELTKRGYTSAQSLGAMKTMLQASVASGENLNDVVESSTAAMEAFGMRGKTAAEQLRNTKKAVNEMAYAADMTSTDFKAMSVAMEYAGPQAKALGYSVGEAASAIGILSNNGLEADKAGTGLRQVLNSLIKPTKGATEALKSVGLSTKDFTDKSGKMKSMSDIFKTLNDHTQNLSKQEKGALFKAIFGSTGESAALILAKNTKNLDDLNKKVEKSYKGQGYVQELAQKNMGSAKMSMRQLKESSEAVKMELGKALLPSLRDTSVAMAKAFNSKDGQHSLKLLGKAIETVAKALSALIIFMVKHRKTVLEFGSALGIVFGVFKGMQLINNIHRTVSEFKALASTSKALGLALKGGLVAGGIMLVIAGLVELYKHNKKFRNFVNGLAKSAKEFGKNTVKTFKDVGTNISKWNKETGKKILNWWNSTKKSFADGWKDLKKKTGDGIDNVKRGWDKLSSETVRSAQQMFNKHKSTFQAGYKVIQDQTNTWHDLVSGRWDRLGQDTERTAQDMFKFNRKIFSDMYNKLNDMTGGRLGDMLKVWQGIFGKVKDAVSNAVGGVHRHFVDLVNGVLKPFKTMIDDIKGGINWVLDKVGGSKIGGDFSISMPSYANGTNDTHPGGFAKVNDGLTAHYREMFMTKDGQVGMVPAKRNLILPLPKGTSVLDGERSYQLSRMFGMIPHYADGVGNAFSSLLSKVGDATDDVLGMVNKIISKPVEFMESVFQKFVHVSTPVKFAAELIKDVPVYIAKQMSNWIKKQFETLANPGGAGVERWRPYIIKAFKTLGVEATATKVSKLLKQIQTESGGNPTVPQKVWDINMANGNPAQGLLQFIPSTFNRWAIPGHKQILNGYDQILAAINALEHGGEGGWGNVGQGHGWANGGLISNHGVYEIAEKNMPEYVIPTDISRRSRAYQLLGEIVTRFRNDDPTLGHNLQSVGNSDRQSDALSHKLDELLSKFDILLRLSGDQVDAIKAQGSLDMQQLYKKEARDARIRQLGF